MVMRRELFRLDWRRKLYDTHQLLHGVDDDADGAAIWLPQDGNVAAGRGGTGAPGPATAVSPDPASEGQHAAGVTVAGIAVGPPLLPIPATAITPSFPEPKPTTPRAPHTPGASPTHELPPPPGSLVAAVSDVSSDARASMMAVSPWPMTTERASMGPKRAPGNPGDATARVTSAEG
jgi:hypothetical protein